MGNGANHKRATTQEANITLGTPSGNQIVTTENLELLLKKLPEKARKAFRVSNVPHNLIAAAELCDAGCGVHLYEHHFEIEFEGKSLYR